MPAYSRCFFCTADAVLNVLRHKQFYTVCPEFSTLLTQVEAISKFVAAVKTDKSKCTGCAGAKVRNAQREVLNNFVRIFFALYDAGKIDALRRVITAAGKINQTDYDSVALAYPGGAAGKKRTLTIGLPGNGESD